MAGVYDTALKNAAQQAAIAISKKKSGNYDKDGLRKTKYKSKYITSML